MPPPSSRACARDVGDRPDRAMRHDRLAGAPTPPRCPTTTPRALVEDRKLHKFIRRTDFFGSTRASQADRRRGLQAARRDDARPPKPPRVQRSHRRVRGLGRRRVREQYDYFPLMTEARRGPAHVRRRARQRRQPDVAAADAAQQRAVPRRHPQRAQGRQRVHHQPQLRRHAGGDRSGRSAAHRRGGSRGRDRPRHADRAAERPLLPSLRLAAPRRAAPVRRAAATAACSARAPRLSRSRPTSAATRAARPSSARCWAADMPAEGAGLLAIREDGDGVERAVRAALAEAGLHPADVGMIVAHGNGTPLSDACEATALAAFSAPTGRRSPPSSGRSDT